MSKKEPYHDTLPRPAAIIAYGMGLAVIASAAVAMFILASLGDRRAEAAVSEQVQRGQYLVTLGLCNDCHTPGYFFGKPDKARFLGGSDVGFHIPDLGVFHGPNLTPDDETGLGRWSTDDIVAAIRTGTRPDGRILAPIMPWHAFASLTSDDAHAIAVYLKSLRPVSNKVPGPFGPDETPTSFVFKVQPPPARGQ
jgi:mono/diheme cytochrome c family protein